MKKQLTNYRQASSINIQQEWKVFEYVAHIYARISYATHYHQPLTDHVKWLLFFQKSMTSFRFIILSPSKKY